MQPWSMLGNAWNTEPALRSLKGDQTERPEKLATPFQARQPLPVCDNPQAMFRLHRYVVPADEEVVPQSDCGHVMTGVMWGRGYCSMKGVMWASVL